MWKPTDEEMKEKYKSYLNEIEMFDGEWGLAQALSYEEWEKDQIKFDYYAWQI